MSISRNEIRKNKFEKTKYTPRKEKKNKWSKNSILLISSFVISFLLIFVITSFNIEMPNFFNSGNKADYKTTNATIYSYEVKTMLEQTIIGNSTQITGYIVRYRYELNGEIFDHEETLGISTKPTFLIYIVKHLNTESFLVQYDSTNPERVNLVQKEQNQYRILNQKTNP